MKHLKRLPTVLVATFYLLLFSFNASAQNVGINATGAAPDKSALLDLSSTNKGFLIPRLTTTQRDAISNPADVLEIFNLTTRCFEVYNANTSSWESFYCLLCPLPDVPNTSAGSNILADEFDANWTATSGATNYYIDVADDADFNNLIIDDQSVGNVTTYNVSGVGLTCGTDYYYRIRAENTCGVTGNSSTEMVTTVGCPHSCGDDITDTRDSKTYGTVEIGSQCWMSENLNYTPTSGNSWCYDNDASNCDTYGLLYNWEGAMDGSSSSPNDVQGACPEGWHLPSDAEWKELEIELGTTQTVADGLGWRGTNAGKALKSSSNWNGNNSSGFTALPGGHRITSGSFTLKGLNGYWWSATEGGSGAWLRRLLSSRSNVYRNTEDKGSGTFVRCVRN